MLKCSKLAQNEYRRRHDNMGKIYSLQRMQNNRDLVSMPQKMYWSTGKREVKGYVRFRSTNRQGDSNTEVRLGDCRPEEEYL